MDRDSGKKSLNKTARLIMGILPRALMQGSFPSATEWMN